MWDPKPQIEDVAARKLANRLGVRKELKKLPTLLREGENVLNMASGTYNQITGLLVLTDLRVMFVGEGIIRSVLEDFPYNRISSVQHASVVMSGQVTVFVSGNRAEITNVMPKSRAREMADEIRQRTSDGLSARLGKGELPSTVPNGSETSLDKLRKLGELREAGVLTEAEFTAKKAQLLAELQHLRAEDGALARRPQCLPLMLLRRSRLDPVEKLLADVRHLVRRAATFALGAT